MTPAPDRGPRQPSAAPSRPRGGAGFALAGGDAVFSEGREPRRRDAGAAPALPSPAATRYSPRGPGFRRRRAADDVTDGLNDAHRDATTAAVAAHRRVEPAVRSASPATGADTVSSDDRRSTVRPAVPPPLPPAGDPAAVSIAGDPAAVSIVVPTLREAANLEPLAERVAGALAGRGPAWEMLFVDDDSRDGSEAVAAGLAARLPVQMVVRRGGRPDLSRAVLDGIARSRHDRVVVMDADLSHPPERIPDLLAALDGGHCDMAVGSRYVAGASTAGDWGLARTLNSRVATLLAAPLVSCADPMAGFFAVDRRALPDPATLRPVGFKIGLELMVRGRLRVREVPIAFDDRRRGHSKLRWRQQLDYLRHLGRLYLHVLVRAWNGPAAGGPAAAP